MKIDITPHVEIATGNDRIVIDTYEIEALYVVRQKNGEDFTTKFNKKQLDEFCPSRTVSEMLKSWEEGIERQIEQYEKALKTNFHPYWTNSHKQCSYHIITKTVTYTGKIVEMPYEMNKKQCKYFEKRIEELKEQRGKMEFVKIC